MHNSEGAFLLPPFGLFRRILVRGIVDVNCKKLLVLKILINAPRQLHVELKENIEYGMHRVSRLTIVRPRGYNYYYLQGPYFE